MSKRRYSYVSVYEPHTVVNLWKVMRDNWSDCSFIAIFGLSYEGECILSNDKCRFSHGICGCFEV